MALLQTNEMSLSVSVKEGKGLFPDYWLDSEDPLGDMVSYIHAKE